MKWVTCIAVAEAPHRFVDVQMKGPYKHWWHEHTFIAKDGGTLMMDKVEYELPLGPLGELDACLDRARQAGEHLRLPLPDAGAPLQRERICEARISLAA